MPVVRIPPPYRGPTRGESQVAVHGATVRECLLDVEALYPGFGPQVFDPDGKVHRFVRLFVNGEPIEAADLGRSVREDDSVEVLAAIAGG
jgi:molybdopterin converting factor small subunit